MELHHIKPEAEGGEDTFGNCIPLCFNCHADMRSYDHKHPKGLKYTENEIRNHRDSWYKKVGQNPGLLALPEFCEVDRSLYQKIRELLPVDGSISFARDHHFGGSFPCRSAKDLHRFWHACKDPAFEFLDADLEGARANLEAAVNTFLDEIGHLTYPTRDMEWCSVPDEWEEEQPERYFKAVGKLNRLGNKVYEAYSTLIRACRRKLSVS